MASVCALSAVDAPFDGAASTAELCALGPLPLLRPVILVLELPGGGGGCAPGTAFGGKGCSFLRSAIGLQKR